MKSDDVFSALEESNLEADSLIKCKIVNVGVKCEKYKLGDIILIKADATRKVKYNSCPEDILVVYNENLIFGKIKK